MTVKPLPPASPSAPAGWRALTTVQVAERLQVSPVTVRRLHRNGELDALPGLRTLRFSATAVWDFLNRKK
jgi:excisionase family DNA binding protein